MNLNKHQIIRRDFNQKNKDGDEMKDFPTEYPFYHCQALSESLKLIDVLSSMEHICDCASVHHTPFHLTVLRQGLSLNLKPAFSARQRAPWGQPVFTPQELDL